MTGEVEFRAGDGARLAGTLVLAGSDGLSPAVLLLSGSGPLDRDSNMPGQRLDVTNAFADALAERGIASLRYDKRGVGRSEGSYLETGFETEIDDAATALRWLCARPEVDAGRVAVLGHSVGALIAAKLAIENESVGALVLLACPTRDGEEVMRWQSERIAASFTGLSRLGAGWFLRSQARTRRRLRESEGDVVRVLWQRLPARWMREVMRHDPSADLAAIRCPVLAITGENDVQVDSREVERIGELVGGSFTGLTPATLTHILRTDPKPGLAAYRAQMKRPVDAELLATVASWLEDRLAAT